MPSDAQPVKTFNHVVGDEIIIGTARYVVLKCRPDGKLELGACRDWAVATGRPNTVWRP
jgi:hypothetical protein